MASCSVNKWPEHQKLKGKKVKFRQLNLKKGREAQDLLMQTARERGAHVLLISEQ